MSIEQDVRQTVAKQQIRTFRSLEQTGLRRDLILDGMERALEQMREAHLSPAH
jgi:hypothetical protein